MTPYTIFYADDDPDDIEYFTDAVQDLYGDVDLHTHMKADKLISALKNPPPSPEILFLDLNMPGKNGFQVLKEIRESNELKNLPVVILSTSADQQTVDLTREMGASYYLPKSNSFSLLKASLHHVLNIDWSKFVPGKENFVYSN